MEPREAQEQLQVERPNRGRSPVPVSDLPGTGKVTGRSSVPDSHRAACALPLAVTQSAIALPPAVAQSAICRQIIGPKKGGPGDAGPC
jgi:hypothetical protein